jgi:hypothetical protein
MKKKLSRWTALALTLGAALCFAAGAAAADTLQTITAYLDSGITVTLDGEVQTLKDGSGTRIYPISYNGSTYLPVRAVAGLAGLEVNWDQATRTVHLGKMSTDVDLIDTYEAYDISEGKQVRSVDKKETDISGIHCSHWLQVHQASMDGKGTTQYASFNVLGKYETLTFQYYAENDVILRVLGDNDSVLFEREVPGGQIAQTVTVPLLKTTQLTFQTEKQQELSPFEGGGDAYIFDAKLS